MVTAIPPAHSFTYDGATINIYHAQKGEGLPKHTHIYSHATFVNNGSIVVRIESGEFVRDKMNTPANLVANEWHEIEALEDNTVFVNVFSENKY